MAKSPDGPRTTLAMRAQAVIDRLTERLRASEEARAAAEADSTKADSILESAVTKAEKLLAIFIFACAIGLALLYAPGTQERGAVTAFLQDPVALT